MLQNHSVLIANPGERNFVPDAFMQGVMAVQDLEGGQLLHALFATRSRQVLGEISEQEASSYLSGMLIGSDVVGATALLCEQDSDIPSITLIGDSDLCHSYRLALEHLRMDVEICDATQIAIAAYEAIYKFLYIGKS